MSWDNVPLAWITQKDGNVCPDCVALGLEAPRKLDNWDTVPGNGDTDCGKRCRCTLLPQPLVIRADLGPVIELKEIEAVAKNIEDIYEFGKLTEQIELWEIETGNLNLPIDDLKTGTPGFYSSEQIDHLEFIRRFREKYKSGKLSEIEKRQIKNANPRWQQ